MAGDESLRIALDLPEMLLAAEAFCVNLVNILGSRWPGGKPAVFSDQLDPADGFVVAGRLRQLRFDRLARQVLRIKFGGVQLCETCLLLGRGRRIDPLRRRIDPGPA